MTNSPPCRVRFRVSPAGCKRIPAEVRPRLTYSEGGFIQCADMGDDNRADNLPPAFYKELLDGLDEAVYFVDTQRRILYWNRAAERLTGIPASEVVGSRCCDDRLHHVNDQGENLCRGNCPLSQTLRDGESRSKDVFLRHREGHRVPVSTRVSPIRDAEGHVVGAAEVFRDNTAALALIERTTRLEKAALLDALTGLPNRRCIESALRSRMEEHDRYGWGFGVLFIDIDRFKVVNDTYGHVIGDRVLRMVARTLAANTRTFDILGRWGGEEFLAVLTNVDAPELASIADRSRLLVRESSLPIEGGRLSVTVSIGGTMSVEGDTVESVLRRADRRMYHSKSNGRNRVTIHIESEDGRQG